MTYSLACTSISYNYLCCNGNPRYFAILILDSLPFALEAFGMQAKLSTIQWFRIATQPLETPFTKTEILNNMTKASNLTVHE